MCGTLAVLDRPYLARYRVAMQVIRMLLLSKKGSLFADKIAFSAAASIWIVDQKDMEWGGRKRSTVSSLEVGLLQKIHVHEHHKQRKQNQEDSSCRVLAVRRWLATPTNDWPCYYNIITNNSWDKIFVVYVWPTKIFKLENFRLYGIMGDRHAGTTFCTCRTLVKEGPGHYGMSAHPPLWAQFPAKV
jgi:hypothetical protein